MRSEVINTFVITGNRPGLPHAPGLVIVLSGGPMPASGTPMHLTRTDGRPLDIVADEISDHSGERGSYFSVFIAGLTKADVAVGSAVEWPAVPETIRKTGTFA